MSGFTFTSSMPNAKVFWFFFFKKEPLAQTCLTSTVKCDNALNPCNLAR